MSAQLPDESTVDFEKELRILLITSYNLSSDTIDQVYGEMQSSDTSFSEAAVRLGFVTEDEVELTKARARRGLLGHSGLVESAIRRIAADRRIVVKHAPPVTPGPELLLAHDPYHSRSERIRALRTELLLLSEGGQGARMMPVLSPGSQEGRSQLAAELALSFAQLGRRTLLVDSDLRKPRQHLLFECENGHGLSTALGLGEKPHFHPVVGPPSMHLLTAGPIAMNPLELLSDGRFERLLSEWRNSYEFVVLDTPPVSQCADGLAIATLAARALLVSRIDSTSYKNTRDMLRRLETTQSKILGAVLNHF